LHLFKEYLHLVKTEKNYANINSIRPKLLAAEKIYKGKTQM
jgi:hypothetical protein